MISWFYGYRKTVSDNMHDRSNLIILGSKKLQSPTLLRNMHAHTPHPPEFFTVVFEGCTRQPDRILATS